MKIWFHLFFFLKLPFWEQSKGWCTCTKNTPNTSLRLKLSSVFDFKSLVSREMYTRAFYQYIISHMWAYLTLQGVPVFDWTSQCLSSPDGDYLLSSFTHNGRDHQYLLTPHLRLHCSLSLKECILWSKYTLYCRVRWDLYHSRVCTLYMMQA